MQLRMRNQFVVSARSSSSSSERRHAVALYVHIREQDVDHFNNATVTQQETKSENAAGSINYIEHVLELLDADSDFEALVLELDAQRTAEDMLKSSKTAFAIRTITSSLVQVQWRALDQSHRGLANVLQMTHRPRQGCFSRKEAATTQSKTKQAVAAAAASGDEEMYTGGMYAPVPMRKLAVEAWLYPLHVVIPSTGDRIPENSSSVTDFFHEDADAQ